MDDIFLNRDAVALKWIPVAVVIIYLLKGLGNYGQTIIMSYIGQRVVTDLRNQLYNHILRQPLSFFTKYPTGNLMARLTSDVGLVQGAVCRGRKPASSRTPSASSVSSSLYFTGTGSLPSSPPSSFRWRSILFCLSAGG